MKKVNINPIKNIIKNNLLMAIPKFTMNDLLFILLPICIEKQNRGIEIKPIGISLKILNRVEFSLIFINKKNAPKRDNIKGNLVIIFCLSFIFKPP